MSITENSKSEKIGILTFHRTENFGSLLQTYGLYRAINKLGYDCEIIDYRCPGIEKREGLQETKEKFSIKRIGKDILLYPNLRKKKENFAVFARNNMKCSIPYYPETIGQANDKYTKFLVGSDLVWARDITDNDYTYFLDFVKEDSKKFAFSASVGYYNKRGDEEQISTYLKNFSSIAVRERETVQWLKDLTGRDSQWVCDPTMLLTNEEWDETVKPINYTSKYVLVYFPDDKRKNLSDARKYAKQHHLAVKYVNYGRPIFGVDNIMPSSLEEFLGLIKNAVMIFTASYHGILFSVYYQKKFLYYNRAHSSRMKSLAERLRIESLCGDNINIELFNDINVANVDINKSVLEFRTQSITVLNDMLKR